MTDFRLVQEVSKGTGVSAATVKVVLDGILSEVQKQLCIGGSVEIQNFGVFRTKVKPEKTGYDLITGKHVKSPAISAPVFDPSLSLKKAVAKQEPSKNTKEDKETNFLLDLSVDDMEVLTHV